MPFTVPEEEKARRRAVVQELQNRITSEELASLVGEEAVVLVEGASRMQDGNTLFWRGRDGGGRIVNFPSSQPGLTGKMIRVRILAAKKHSLAGETRGEPW
jgi:tRNA-2-methylthio-N6-dimethylallyladenosine synthase